MYGILLKYCSVCLYILKITPFGIWFHGKSRCLNVKGKLYIAFNPISWDLVKRKWEIYPWLGIIYHLRWIFVLLFITPLLQSLCVAYHLGCKQVTPLRNNVCTVCTFRDICSCIRAYIISWVWAKSMIGLTLLVDVWACCCGLSVVVISSVIDVQKCISAKLFIMRTRRLQKINK